MRHSFVFSGLAASAAALLLAAGCASDTPAPLVDYQPESFNASSAYMHHYAALPARTCEAARRALLSQGYVLDDAKPDQVSGRKDFQPDPDHHVQLAFRAVCVAQGQGAGGGTTVFVSGLQDQYTLRKVKQSASLGVGAFGSLSVPFQGGTDTMVKVASETVTDASLYQRLFDLIGDFLKRGQVPEGVVPPPAAAASTAPAAAVAASGAASAPAPESSPAIPAASDSAAPAASIVPPHPAF